MQFFAGFQTHCLQICHLLYCALWAGGDVLDCSSHSPLGLKVSQQTSGKWRCPSAGPSLLPGLSSDHRGSVVCGLMNHTQVSEPVTMRQRAVIRSYLYSTSIQNPNPMDRITLFTNSQTLHFLQTRKLLIDKGRHCYCLPDSSISYQSYCVYPGYRQDQNSWPFHCTLQQTGSRFALSRRCNVWWS